MSGARWRVNELDGAYEPRRILIMTYSPKWDSSEVSTLMIMKNKNKKDLRF